LLWEFNSLYVVVNDSGTKHPSGLYRLRDTDGDDKLDQITLLKEFKDRDNNGPGAGEHGPHGIVRGPDNLLYIVAGNFTNVPDGLASSSPARNWAEDQLLERMPDGKGHDPTIMAPGGWVCRTDENGKKWEVFATGMRNAYDIAFNSDGELFTYDSDMEWDIGAPWYRPTRVCQLVSGAEFGWRNGSGKWPAYYPDSVGPVLNIGLGSPTGVTFGYGSKFPARYQQALFANCWAYGKIYAVHLQAKGAGYTATFEPFVIGKPFDVTDVVINKDGAMYVTIGGRGTQSGLYRITYVGNDSIRPTLPGLDVKAAKARAIRHTLESFHGKRDPAAISYAWPFLNSDDRLLRFAARVAIESQDPNLWTSRALGANPPTAAANALVALCRVGDPSLRPQVLQSLARINLSKLSEEQLLEVLRVYELCFIRMGRPSEAQASAILATLEPMYPSASRDVTHELCQLLVYLKSSIVIPRSMALLSAASTQEEQLFYVFNLRNVSTGWTVAERTAYFQWLNHAQKDLKGGASYQLFLKHVREDAARTLSDSEKIALGPLAKPEELPGAAKVATPARKFVRHWQMQDLTPKLELTKSGRSYEKGKAAFAAVSCLACHRFNGEGGASGPDITGVGARFQQADLLEALILPSKIISDQYQTTDIITRSTVYVGTIQSEDAKKVVLRPSPLSSATEVIAKKDIKTRQPSKISIMPEGLLDVLSEDEVLDLLAYIRSAGDPKDAAFQPIKPTAPTASVRPSAP
jgi:putative heme-binding domain-containing protein